MLIQCKIWSNSRKNEHICLFHGPVGKDDRSLLGFLDFAALDSNLAIDDQLCASNVKEHAAVVLSP